MKYLMYLQELSPKNQSKEYLQYVNALQSSEQVHSVNYRRDSLIIPQVTRNHGGIYTCTSRNRLGMEATKTFIVSITETIPKLLSLGDNQTISCYRDSRVDESFEWTRVRVLRYTYLLRSIDIRKFCSFNEHTISIK